MPKPGETVVVDCDNCNTEFEITLEPKAKTDTASGERMPAQRVQYCPFCGADDDNLHSPDDDENEEA